MSEPVIQVENLVKRYGDVEAVRGVSFTVEEGEVFGLLGPNGAGKTTTVEILEGLRTLDSGRVSVCGLDPQRQSSQLKNEIGAALQSTSLPDKLKVFEALKLFASFYSRRRDPEVIQRQSPPKEQHLRPSRNAAIICFSHAATPGVWRATLVTAAFRIARR